MRDRIIFIRGGDREVSELNAHSELIVVLLLDSLTVLSLKELLQLLDTRYYNFRELFNSKEMIMSYFAC